MSQLVRRGRAFFRLAWRQRLALVESTALFWFFVGALKVVPFRRFKRLLGPAGPKHDPLQRHVDRPVPEAALPVGRWMRRIARKHPDTCLAQALAGRVMLRRRKLPSLISFGVRSDGHGDFLFHAWLVHDDVVLTGGGALRDYSVLSTFYDEPGAGRPDEQ